MDLSVARTFTFPHCISQAYPVFTIDVRDCDRVFTFYTLHLVLNETLTLMTAAVPAEFGDGEKDEC
jgi:hypothetical protein